MAQILLTGASSYVGARVYFDLRDHFTITGTYHTSPLSPKFRKLDTTKPDEVRNVVNDVRPDTIIHLAANASASWCEAHPEEARKLNRDATQSVVDAAEQVNARVIFLSSFAAQDTSNIYGQTKAESETIVKKADKWIILRPSLIIGFSPNTTNDRPFNRLLKNLDRGTPAVYDTSWKFQPTYLHQISEIIKIAIDQGWSGETIPIAVPELVSRFDIAHDILSQFNISVEPIDKHDTSAVIRDDLSKLKELNLSTYEYDQVIKKCVEEIKHRDRFMLD